MSATDAGTSSSLPNSLADQSTTQDEPDSTTQPVIDGQPESEVAEDLEGDTSEPGVSAESSREAEAVGVNEKDTGSQIEEKQPSECSGTTNETEVTSSVMENDQRITEGSSDVDNSRSRSSHPSRQSVVGESSSRTGSPHPSTVRLRKKRQHTDSPDRRKSGSAPARGTASAKIHWTDL